MARFTVHKKAWALAGKPKFTVEGPGAATWPWPTTQINPKTPRRTVVDGTWTSEGVKALKKTLEEVALDQDEHRRRLRELNEQHRRIHEERAADLRRRLESRDADIIKAALAELEAEAHEHQRHMEDRTRQAKAQGDGAKAKAETKAKLHRKILTDARALARKPEAGSKPYGKLAWVRGQLATKYGLTVQQIRNIVRRESLEG